MIDYSEALQEMHKGNVVKYVGTVNGNVMSDNGASFCMCRGCIFLFDKNPDQVYSYLTKCAEGGW